MWLLWLLATAGILTVRSPHYGATVIVDRQPVGRVPLDPLELPAGLHLVELRQSGETRWSQVVYVPPARTVELDATWASAATPAASSSAPPAQRPPSYTLEASAGVELAHLGDATDLDLVHAWRVEGRRLGWRGLSAVVDVRGRADVAGDAALPGGETLLVERTTDGANPGLRLDEARLRAKHDGATVDGGRMLALAPGRRLYVLDGIRARGDLGDWEVRAAAGARAAPLGARAVDPWLGSVGVSWERLAALDAVWAETLHLDASGAGDLGPLRLDGAVRTVGETVALASATARWATHAWIRGAARRACDGPFEPPPRPLDLHRRVEGWEVSLGGEVGPTSALVAARAGVVDHAEAELASRWRLGAWRLGAVGGGLVARGDPLLDAWGRGAAELGWSRASLRARTSAGAAWMRAGERDRWLPEASADLSVPLGGPLSLGGRLLVAGVHPEVHPQGGPMVYGGLEVRLR